LTVCIHEIVYIASRRENAVENAAKHYSEDHPGEKGNIIPYSQVCLLSHSSIQVDVTSKESIEKLVEEVSKKEKYINLLSTTSELST
jgi:macrodomain Ter protein organizer (MatP/YcbG family)